MWMKKLTEADRYWKLIFVLNFQVGYVLGFIVIASIILVGLLVYYVGVMNVSNELDNCLSTTAATSTTSKPVKEKVSYYPNSNFGSIKNQLLPHFFEWNHDPNVL